MYTHKYIGSSVILQLFQMKLIILISVMMIFRKMLGQLNEKPRKYIPLYLPLQIEGSKTKEEVIAHRIWKYYMQDFIVNMVTISGLIDVRNAH